jgi:hypothetical protein
MGSTAIRHSAVRHSATTWRVHAGSTLACMAPDAAEQLLGFLAKSQWVYLLHLACNCETLPLV